MRDKSTVLLEQVRTIDCDRLKDYVGCLDAETMRDIDHAIAVSFGLDKMLFPAEDTEERNT